MGVSLAQSTVQSIDMMREGVVSQNSNELSIRAHCRLIVILVALSLYFTRQAHLQLAKHTLIWTSMSASILIWHHCR